MMAELFPDPNSPPSQADMLAMGPDCVRHPVVGCIIANNGTPPEDQARSYLRSLRIATQQQIAGRAGDLSEDDYQAKLAALVAWEAAGNFVSMPVWPAVFKF
jgi:hypothetical protein